MMKFCSDCAAPLLRLVPPGDHLTRSVCSACGTVHYENPRIVVGCVPEWQGRILLCRRAIEPRLGFWTTPAGFLEIGETLQDAAARESLEEAEARVDIGALLSVTNVLHAAQVHVMFRARMQDPQCAPGRESLETGLYEEAQIPWTEIAFPSIEFALHCFLADRRAGVSSAVHFSSVDRSIRA
jgi:ADP-ribose pyrophosphatase YjhB (NUDIX family)